MWRLIKSESDIDFALEKKLFTFLFSWPLIYKVNCKLMHDHLCTCVCVWFILVSWLSEAFDWSRSSVRWERGRATSTRRARGWWPAWGTSSSASYSQTTACPPTRTLHPTSATHSTISLRKGCVSTSPPQATVLPSFSPFFFLEHHAWIVTKNTVASVFTYFLSLKKYLFIRKDGTSW